MFGVLQIEVESCFVETGLEIDAVLFALHRMKDEKWGSKKVVAVPPVVMNVKCDMG